MNIHILKPGLMTTVQDLGRRGYQRFGVVEGGAADPFAAKVANVLVGNLQTDAVLEMAVVGPQLLFDQETLVAWCGADFDATLDGHPLPKDRPVRVPENGVVDFKAARQGSMAWLAIAGGIEVSETMGSRATYLAAGIGGMEGRALKAGDDLPLGTMPAWSQKVLEKLRQSGRDFAWSIPPERLGRPTPRGILRVVRGPEWDWFSADARYGIFRNVYEVTKDSNRMGTRLNGKPLPLVAPREMVSAAVSHGVIQVPHSGQPILLSADRQTLGGYPRIGAVATCDHGILAQLRPGDPVRFYEIAVEESQALLLERERHFSIARLHLSTLLK